MTIQPTTETLAVKVLGQHAGDLGQTRLYKLGLLGRDRHTRRQRCHDAHNGCIVLGSSLHT